MKFSGRLRTIHPVKTAFFYENTYENERHKTSHEQHTMADFGYRFLLFMTEKMVFTYSLSRP